MQTAEVYELLTQEYTLIMATTPEDFNHVKEIREEVYAFKYGKPLEFLESIGLLFDRDDQQSFIYLLQHKKTQKYVGTVRAFFMNENTPSKKLPLQQTVKDQKVFSYLTNLPIIEISRAALQKNIPYHHSFSELQLRAILSFGLMIAIRLNLFLYPPRFVFAIMEPSAHRMLKRQNVNFEPISDPVDSYGTLRIPYAIERTKLLKETEENMGQITRHYLKKLCENPDDFWHFIDSNPYLERSDIELERICKLFKEYGDDVDLSLLLGEEDAFTAS